MFKTLLLKQKNSDQPWWIVLAVAGAGVVLILSQLNSWGATVPADVSPTPAPQPEMSLDEPAAESFLDEYDPEEETLFGNSKEAEERSGWEISIDVILKLSIVLGLVFVAMRGLRWLQRNRQQNVTGGATINVLETTGLAPGRSLHLVVVGEKTLLLGATDHQITVLSELADANIPVPEEEPSFTEALNLQEQQAAKPIPAAVPIDDDAAEYASEWQSTLKNLRSGIRQVQQAVGG
jgi:flagellar biosynthetic protein FliO